MKTTITLLFVLFAAFTIRAQDALVASGVQAGSRRECKLFCGTGSLH
jgi:hypothetical protein